MAKLTEAQVVSIRCSSLSDTALAQEIGVSRSTVARARAGRSYPEVSEPIRGTPSRGGWKKKDIPCQFPESIALPGEEWRPVVGWERHYRVSHFGRLYSLHQTGRLVVGMRVRGGYRVLKLRDGDRRAHGMVHRMVLDAFVGPAPEGYQGCHGLGGVCDNSLANLRWDTKEANQADKVLHGTDNYSGQKLTANDVRLIRVSPGISDEEWARRLGVTGTSVLQARTGKTWPEVDVPPLRRRAP